MWVNWCTCVTEKTPDLGLYVYGSYIAQGKTHFPYTNIAMKVSPALKPPTCSYITHAKCRSSRIKGCGQSEEMSQCVENRFSQCCGKLLWKKQGLLKGRTGRTQHADFRWHRATSFWGWWVQVKKLEKQG